MKSVFLILLSLALTPAWGQGVVNDFKPKPTGGRVGLHGMVLFGAGPYFLDHIPMLSPPHDYQVISEVAVKDAHGTPLSVDFSKATFTFRPEGAFSLNDVISGKLKAFRGAIYQGGFEQGGTVVPGLESVSVEVRVVKLARPLPADVADVATVEFKDQNTIFEVNVITPKRNYQQIRNESTGQVLWCATGPDFFDSCP